MKIEATNYNQTPIETKFRITKDKGYWTSILNDFVDAYIDDASVSLVLLTENYIFLYKKNSDIQTRFNQYSTFNSKQEVLGYIQGLMDAKRIAERKEREK